VFLWLDPSKAETTCGAGRSGFFHQLDYTEHIFYCQAGEWYEFSNVGKRGSNVGLENLGLGRIWIGYGYVSATACEHHQTMEPAASI
jgi:hypothetical protein